MSIFVPDVHPVIRCVGRFVAREDLEVLGEIGEGFFSVVHKVR